MKNIDFLSVVIPAYNEQDRISNTVHKIKEYMDKRKIKHELVVVNDGSSDNTKDTLNNLKKNYKIRVFNNKENRGKGYSTRKGVLKSKGDAILFTDADLSTPIKEFAKLERWYSKGYKICIGSRRMRESKIIIKQPFHRIMSGYAFAKIVQIVALGNIKDSQCGFKLFNDKVAKKLFKKQKTDGFSFDVEILYLAKKNNIKIKEVPVVWIDSAKHSKVNVLKHSLIMLFETIKIRLIHG